jgi:hypothetical protein
MFIFSVVIEMSDPWPRHYIKQEIFHFLPHVLRNFIQLSGTVYNAEFYISHYSKVFILSIGIEMSDPWPRHCIKQEIFHSLPHVLRNFIQLSGTVHNAEFYIS